MENSPSRVGSCFQAPPACWKTAPPKWPIRRNEKSAQSFLHRVFLIAGHPKSRGIPATPCLKQQKKAHCIEFLSGTSQGRGQGYPDVRVPDIPGISWPKTLSLGCFFQSCIRRFMTIGVFGLIMSLPGSMLNFHIELLPSKGA